MKMLKEMYETPKLEVVAISCANVVTASEPDNDSSWSELMGDSGSTGSN